jgi:hypothetical protein
LKWGGSRIIKAETVKNCFAKAGFGKSKLKKVIENTAAISNLRQGKELSCDTKNSVQSDGHLSHTLQH